MPTNPDPTSGGFAAISQAGSALEIRRLQESINELHQRLIDVSDKLSASGTLLPSAKVKATAARPIKKAKAASKPSAVSKPKSIKKKKR